MDSVRKIAFGLLIFGLLFVVINVITVSSSDFYLPKLLISGIILSITSLGLIISPPKGEISTESFFTDIWFKSSYLNKSIYLTFLVFSLLVTYLVFKYFGLDL